jgi:hypothetical protein
MILQETVTQNKERGFSGNHYYEKPLISPPKKKELHLAPPSYDIINNTDNATRGNKSAINKRISH